MPQKISFHAQPRTLQGKKVNSLRQEGLVPANIVASQADSVMISLNRKEFKKMYRQAGDTSVIYLQVGETAEEKPVLVEEVALHPVTGEVQHVILRQVNLKKKLEAAIPVEVIGENKVPDSVVITVHDEIMVRALPTDLPEKFLVDISALTAIGQAITLADLQFDRSKVELVTEEDMATPVVLLQEIKAEVVEEPPVEVAAEGAEGAAPAAEGSTPETGKSAETGDKPAPEAK